MPVKRFELSKEAEKRRAGFKLFFCSALIGASFGLLVRLFVLTQFTQEIVFALIGLSLLIAVITFYAMKTVLRPEDIHHIIEIYLVYNRGQGTFVPITNRLGYVMQSYMKFRDGSKRDQEPVNILKKGDVDSIQKLAMDLVIYELLDKLSMEYKMGWAPKLRYFGISYGRFSFKGEEEGIKSKTIRYSDIPEELKKDNLFLRLYDESLMSFGKLEFSVPPNTRFKWTGVDATQRESVFSFCSRYCNIDLTVSKGHWGVGLYPIWGKFVVARGARNDDDSFSYLQEHYAHMVFELSIRVKFSWFWSLWSSSNDYFNWAEDLLDKFHEFFSFEKEYLALQEMGRRFELD